jgi:hypothetical protein
MTQDFCLSSKPAPYLIRGHGNRRIASYVTVAATKKTDKKTSQNAQVIKLPFLNNG